MIFKGHYNCETNGKLFKGPIFNSDLSVVAFDYEGVIEIAKNNPPHKMPWLLKVIPEMRRLKQPSLGQITALNGFPNIGLKEIVYEAIAKRTYEAVEMLRNEHGYLLNI